MKKHTLIFIFLVLFAVGCGSTTGSSLDNTTWQLISIDGNPLIEGSILTLGFDSEGQASGGAGCNSFFGSYELDGDAISFSGVANTEMFCMDPEGLMDQENDYLAILHSAAVKVEIRGGELILTTGDGRTLTFATRNALTIMNNTNKNYANKITK